VMRALKYLMLLGVPVAAIGILFSQHLVTELFGDSFSSASDTLSIILVGAALYILVAGAQNALFSIGEQRKVLYIMVSGLIIKFALNLVLIPMYGKEGAAYSLTIATFIMVLIAIKLLLNYGYNVKSMIFIGGKIVVAAVVAMVCIMMLNIDYRVELILFGIIYIIGIFSLRLFDRYEFEILNNLLRKVTKRNE